MKLMSMNLYDMEDNSRLENLVDFKMAYRGSLQAVGSALKKFFPQMTAENVQDFIYAFFPFMFGIYPYTAVTPKQREAMELAGIDAACVSVYALTSVFVSKLLHGILKM